VLFEARLEHGHGSQTTTSHSNIRKLVGGTVGSDSEEVRSSGINTTKDEVSTNVALVTGYQLESGVDNDDKLTGRGTA
jgi:hypothetical protein